MKCSKRNREKHDNGDTVFLGLLIIRIIIIMKITITKKAMIMIKIIISIMIMTLIQTMLITMIKKIIKK